MLRFILRRLLLAIPVLFGVIFVVFALSRLIPGDPCRAQLGEKATPAVCEAFIHRYGFDQPIPVQFGVYLGNLAQGDFGTSIKYGRPVTTVLWERLPVTVELTIMALLFATIVGILLGVLSASRRNSIYDVITMLFANIGISIPVFVLGLVLAWLFGVVLRDSPDLAAAIRPIHGRDRPRAADAGLGSDRPAGSVASHRGLRVEHRDPQRAADRAVGGRWAMRCGT